MVSCVFTSSIASVNRSISGTTSRYSSETASCSYKNNCIYRWKAKGDNASDDDKNHDDKHEKEDDDNDFMVEMM